jgi:hypothetical protein
MLYFYLDESISLLDMTRIPSEWYQEIEKKLIPWEAKVRPGIQERS